MRPHSRQPTRLPHPWDSPGKNTGVGCHFLLQCRKVKSESEVTQLCPTLSDPMDYSPPGSSIHGIFQARVLEWGAIAFSGWLNLCSPIWTMHILETTMKINSKTWHFCPEELTFHILFCIHCLLNYILIIFSIFHLCQKPLLLITLRACLERQYFLGESFSIPEAVTTETQQ